MPTLTINSTKPSKALSATLWIVQILLGVLFIGTALWKLLTPIPELAATFSWMGEVPVPFLYLTTIVELLGGVGIVLPSLLRIKPDLAVLAALGCAALMAFAIVFHLLRGEGADTLFNIFVLALALFIFWGRRYRAPIAPRD